MAKTSRSGPLGMPLLGRLVVPVELSSSASLTLQRQEAVSGVLVHGAVDGKIDARIWSLVLREVVDGLRLAAAQRRLLGVEEVGDSLGIRVAVRPDPETWSRHAADVYDASHTG